MQKETTHKSEKQVFSVVKRAKSFTYAMNGIRLFVKTTHNSWIQMFLAIVAIILGAHFHIETTEWLFIVLSIGFVLTAESFNTAFEFDMDLTSPRLHPYAKYTKDVAAGAVLIASITALCVGLIIFLPKIFLTL